MFDSKKEVMDFFEDCILMSEGSERERYTNIYFTTKTHLNDNKRCFTDDTNSIYTSKIDPEEIDIDDEKILKDEFNITKRDLLMFKANNTLAQKFSRVYESVVERFNDIDELYYEYLCKSNEDKFYYFKDDSIICIDTTASGTDKYWLEEFPLEDYEYANKWLNCEIEYEDYLHEKKQELEI